MKKNNQIKIISLSLVSTITLFAGTYDYQYEPRKVITENNLTIKEDFFMNTKFKEIVRFDSLYFDGSELDDDSHKLFQSIIEKVRVYVQNKEDVKVKIIGHSSEVDIDPMEFVQYIESKFIEFKIDKDILYSESRLDEDNEYSTKSLDLNNRVSVVLYVVKDKTIAQ